MTYFEDLTPYTYLPDRPAALNIGWLDVAHSFAAGEVDPVIVDKIRELSVVAPVNQTRGFHICNVCKYQHEPPTATWHEVTRQLGSAEIWLSGKEGLLYACPDMIVHYIEVHRYQPPSQFLDAVTDYLSGTSR